MTNPSASRQTLAIGIALLGIALVPLPAWAQEAGAVTIVLAEEPTDLDACNASRSANGRVLETNVIEPLVTINPDDGLVGPNLATSWEQVDELTWRFHLREGVTFHDGAPFDAAAAAASIDRAANGEVDCHVRGEYFALFTVTPTVVDDFTLDLTTSLSVPILPTYMTNVMIDSPNTPRDALAHVAVGTGPYRIDSYQPGLEILLSRYEDWWEGEPLEVEAARFIWRSESSVAAAMVEIGEADLAPYIAQQDATHPELDVPYPTTETVYLRIDTLLPPLDDIRLREALNLAVDREALRGTLFPSEAIPATQIVVPGIAGHNPSLPVYDHDPVRARALVEEARADGVATDTPIQYFVRNGHFVNAGEIAEAITAMWTDIGLNINLRPMEATEWSEYNFAPLPADRGANVLQARTGSNVDPVFNTPNKYMCDSAQAANCDPELDVMIETALAASGDERVAIWQAIFQRTYEEYLSVPLFHLVSFARVGERIHFEPSVELASVIALREISFR